ncbi:MAG: UvrD-helicase domain-containing protein [Bdellovibrionales bacterium]|nr:UvrD-helicase domain-containing protein [Bdellovibrionales bacterium]
MNFLKHLNEPQRLATAYGEGPMLVLAGAGSGKTRVLTHRMAYLISELNMDPTQIFAVTFTNKAAAEMRSRVQHLLGDLCDWRYLERDLWVSTFHSACVRILRSDIHHLGYSPQFTIYDDGDQLSVIKACMKELNISEQMLAPKAIQARINKIKNEGEDHTTYKSAFGGPTEDAFIRLFERYAAVLKQASALDFADLILLTVRLFQTNTNVLRAYQQRFQYVLIDEYQDTNRCQYLLVRLLAGTRANICAVGDEDQSIYRWRGADISNILNFERDYPNAKIFKLEENYRSTKNIIEAASHVIAYNTERRDKQLWTSNAEGSKIRIIEAYDEHDEATKIANEISLASAEHDLNQLAVFYRTNAQSRLIEDTLRAKGINYEIYGGVKFYARLEVKDALAYLKLLSNPDDDVSFRRIVNVPARGIGNVTIERMGSKARELGLSYYSLLKVAFEDGDIDWDPGRSRKNLHKFHQIMKELEKAKPNLLPSDLLDMVLEESGYRKSLLDEKTVESQSRLENLAELKQSLVEYELRQGAENPESQISLEGFLEQIALVSDIDRFDPQAPAIKMMTIHMAKGLEFDVVFISGLEEELFPNIRPWEAEQPEDIEEERRLFYVGMTRAKKELNLFYAKNRTVFGNTQYRVMSRFIEEIPSEYVELKKADYFTRRRPYVDRPGLAPRQNSWDADFDFDQSTVFDEEVADADFEDGDAFRAGHRVLHPIFGEGVVRKTVGKDKLLVEFRGQGMKKISRKFSQLKHI